MPFFTATPRKSGIDQPDHVELPGLQDHQERDAVDQDPDEACRNAPVDGAAFAQAGTEQVQFRRHAEQVPEHPPGHMDQQHRRAKRRDGDGSGPHQQAETAVLAADEAAEQQQQVEDGEQVPDIGNPAARERGPRAADPVGDRAPYPAR